MGNHCIYTVCRTCGEEYCLRCESGVCPKCGTPWDAPEKNDMGLNELTDEAMKLPKKDKTALINALLRSMSSKGSDDGTPKMPVNEALDTFGRVYRELKGTDFIGLKDPKNFGAMKRLLTSILQKIVERSSGDMVVSGQTLVLNLETLMRAVPTMPNKWYFNDGFTPSGLASKFNEIYSSLTQNNSHERTKRAFDCL